MGLMDSLMGAAQQALGGQQAGGGVDWVQLVGGLLSSGGAQGGGLAGLMQQLQAGGLGEQLQSWISTGANLPVSADQIGAALGSGTLAQLASQAGVSHAEVGEQLSHWLPRIVDQLSPGGQMPSTIGAGDLAGMLGQLLQR